MIIINLFLKSFGGRYLACSERSLYYYRQSRMHGYALSNFYARAIYNRWHAKNGLHANDWKHAWYNVL